MSTPPSDRPSAQPAPLDAEERAFRDGFERLVEWHRVAQSRLLFVAFLPAFVLLPLGGCLVGISLLPRVAPSSFAGPLTLLGVLVTASGPIWALAQLLRSIRRDLYVAIRVDGLSVRLDPARAERIYPWDAIESAEYREHDRALHVGLRSGESVAISAVFSGLDLPELGRRIRDARRLAVWNRLEPSFASSAVSE